MAQHYGPAGPCRNQELQTIVDRFSVEVYWLWGRWIEATGEAEDALFVPMLDANDDLQASLFDSLHGYYRTAFSALRNVIELMTIGTCGVLTRTPLYEEWRKGSTEFKFGTACDLLSSDASLAAFNEGLKSKGHQSLWDAETGGVARRIQPTSVQKYVRLCSFSSRLH